MLWTAWLDESGTGDDVPIVVVATCLLSEAGFQGLSREWKTLLSAYRLRAFHMVDCYAGRKEFKSWDRSRCIECAGAFVSATAKYVQWSAGVGVHKKVYKQLTANPAEFGKPKHRYNPVDPRIVGGLYGIASLACFMQMSRHIKAVDSDGWIACFAESGAKGQGQIDRLIQMHTRDSQAREESRIASLTWGNKNEYLPLQAADVVAWAIRRTLRQTSEVHVPDRAAELIEPLSSIPHVWKVLAPREIELFDRAVRTLAEFNPTFSWQVARQLESAIPTSES